jgi:ribosomal protein L11 methyltransferase
MSRTTVWKVTITTVSEAEDAIAELLQRESGQPASSYTATEKGTTLVSAYFSRKPPWPGLRVRLAVGLAAIKRCGIDVGAGKLSLSRLRRQDWADSWKRHFKRIEVGRALLIKPSWNRRKPRKGQAVVILDPGLSFGTGQHPTTSFCLQQLVLRRFEFRVSSFESKQQQRANSKPRTQNPTPSFWDIGTGSGILAISAAKLGYAPVEAFDFDPEAVRIARANARDNHVLDKIRLHRADLTKLPRRSIRRYDVICANLISTLLLSQRDRILQRLKAGGTLVVAGILKKEFHIIRSAYEGAGLKLIAARSEKEWRSGAFFRQT